MLMSIGPSLSSIHGSSLNSFCGWKASFLPSEPNSIAEQDRANANQTAERR